MSIDQTLERITGAALKIIVSRGVAKTSLTDVAFEAGVTRVTVHRYCGDKKGMVQAVCRRISSIFRSAAEEGDSASLDDINRRLCELGDELSRLPQGQLLARFDEIKRLYPDVYAEFREEQNAAVDQMFFQTLAAATREGTLREGINPEVLKAIFFAAVVGLIENPSLISTNTSLAEIFTTVVEVFRNGILREQGLGIRD